MFTPYTKSNIDQIETQQIEVVHPSFEDLPKSSFGYTTNNVYPGFPPLMNDGRSLIASWQPDAVLNQSLLKSNGITSNWDYRKYLVKNANSIMRQNFTEAANDTGFFIQERKTSVLPNFGPILSGTPKNYSSFMQPEHNFGKFESDLKANYLSREQLQSRLNVPIVSQEELIRMHR
jgi:hypothetical protein